MQNGCMRGALSKFSQSIDLKEAYSMLKQHDKLNRLGELHVKRREQAEPDPVGNRKDYEINALFLNPFLLKKRQKRGESEESENKRRLAEYLKTRNSCKSPSPRSPVRLKKSNIRFAEPKRMTAEDLEKEDVRALAQQVLIMCNVQNRKDTKTLRKGEGLLASTANSTARSTTSGFFYRK